MKDALLDFRHQLETVLPILLKEPVAIGWREADGDGLPALVVAGHVLSADAANAAAPWRVARESDGVELFAARGFEETRRFLLERSLAALYDRASGA